MTPDEIVKALKLCAGDRCCEGCIEEQSVRHWQIVMREAAGLIESLRAEVDESQRREQAAVEDVKIIADTYREKNCDDGICGLCKFDADHGLDGDANECPGFETDDCFEWRGPQETGEGETE